MPASQQVKLLRVLQEKRVRPVGSNREIPLNFKLLSATNRDLGAAVAQGRFRDDLYYRLNVFSLQMPPLRERVEDVKAIAQYYLQRYARQYQVAIDAVSVYAGVAQHFANYHWPGNVRTPELYRASGRQSGGTISGAKRGPAGTGAAGAVCAGKPDIHIAGFPARAGDKRHSRGHVAL